MGEDELLRRVISNLLTLREEVSWGVYMGPTMVFHVYQVTVIVFTILYLAIRLNGRF